MLILSAFVIVKWPNYVWTCFYYTIELEHIIIHPYISFHEKSTCAYGCMKIAHIIKCIV